MQASLKITAIEREILRRKYGTEGSGLRVALDLMLHTDPATGGTGVATKKRPRHVAEPPMLPPEVLAQMDPLVPHPAPDGLDAELGAADGTVPHRHRRGEKLNEVYDHGTPIRTYRCAVPGCTTTLTA